MDIAGQEIVRCVPGKAQRQGKTEKGDGAAVIPLSCLP
jgi:hypothetical protein